MRTFSHSVIAILVTAACAALPAMADTLYLRNGEQELGRLREITEDAVVFEGPGGSLKTLPKAEVNQIQLQRARMFDDINSAQQVTDPDLKTALESQPGEADFPADGTATLLQRRTIDLTTPGVVKDTNRIITKILRQRGEDAASQLVWYFEDTDQPDIDFALTVTPDGRVLHLADAAVKNESVFASLPDYRRLARYRFAAKEPAPGSILDIQYSVARKRDSALEPFYFDEAFRYSSPLLRKEVVLIVPANREASIAYAVRNENAAPIEQTREENDGVVRITWKLAKPQPGILPESLMPPVASFTATLTIGERATWDQIVKDYSAALDALPPLSDELKARAAELAAQGGPQAIHNFVAKSIRTVPVPHNQYRPVPHAPELTAKRGMANELDKNFLYSKMLQAAGIPATFALVRDRSAGPLNENVPSIRAFDRSAVYIEADKAFSSVASDLIPYGTLPSGLQNTAALMINPAEAKLANTQISTFDQENISSQFDATLQADGTLDLKLTFTGAGNTGVWMRGMKSLNQQQLKNQLQQAASSIHQAALLKNYATSDFNDLAVQPSLTMEMTIPGYAVKAGDLLLFNIPGVTYDAGDVGRPTREFDMFWSQIVNETTTGTIRIPQGMKPYAMPEAVNFDCPTVAYQAALKAEGETIQFTDAYQLKVQTAGRDAYPDYKKCHETRANLARQRIILTAEQSATN